MRYLSHRLGFFVLTLMFFRAASIADAWTILSAMAGASSDVRASVSTALHAAWQQAHEPWSMLQTPAAWITAGFALVLWPVNSNQLAARFRPTPFSAVVVCLMLGWCVLHLSQVTQFIYFNF